VVAFAKHRVCQLGAAELVVNARGMREGIVIEAVARERGSVGSFDRMRAVREASRGFAPGADHAEQVRRLSCELFDALAGPLALPADDRPLLEAAALLHDIGYAVSHDQHNKHSHHLIMHADLPGFTADERRMIAAIARYHRGSMPKPRHEAMQGLSETEIATVSALASVLRIADGLDRSQAQRVSEVTAALGAGGVRLHIEGGSPLDAEIYGAMHKADLFERTFGLSVSVTGPNPRRPG
jgi:exopolyphosphatase/guanosine-5'-triphosphate,3'-diphosphate pyrophosphatase